MIAKYYHLYQKEGQNFTYTLICTHTHTHTDMYSSEKATKILVTISWEVN